ncbi:DUF742 domain-containing protein [Streptomyces sp. NPDC051572]|uniref:DUF742 domain-containing protein n=1 Tax=unclassified Streptomyces TaxID=2593676 RepID=UPI00344E2D3D
MKHWSQQEPWSDESAGPLIRPYTLTGGRTPPIHTDIELISLVSTIRLPTRADRLQPEQQHLLALCRAPTALVEIAARLDLHIAVVRVLLGDLLDHELISVTSPSAAGTPDARFLQAVIDGIRRL